MAISVIASAFINQASTSSAINTTGADALVVFVARYSTEPTLSDSKGNTFTAQTDHTFVGDFKGRFFLCLGPTVGTGHTFSLSGTAGANHGLVIALSGVKQTSPLDGQSSSYATGSPISPGSITPSENNCILITGVAGYNTGTVSSIDSGFTTTQIGTGDYFHHAYGLAYKIQTTAGAENPAWTLTSPPPHNGAVMIALKQSPPPDSTPPSDVTNLTATKFSNGRIDIDSDAATDNVSVAGYETQRRIDGGTWITLTPTTRSFQDTENFPTTAGVYSFEYRRKAFDSADTPNYSANWSSSPAAVTITISAPGDVSGLAKTAETETSIDLDWTNATAGSFSLADYRVYRNTSNSHSGETTADVGGTTSALAVTGLTPGQQYFFWVKAKDNQGNFSANYSTVLSAYTKPRIDSTSPLNAGIVDELFSQTLAKTGGAGTWSLESGAPGWMSINASTGQITGTPDATGTTGSIVIRFTQTDSGLYDEVTYSITVTEILPLNYGFDPREVELFCEAENLGLSDGANVTSFTDQSVNARHLVAASSYPTLQTSEIGTMDVVRFSSSNPLKYTGAVNIRCGWIVAKYSGATFPDDADGGKGLLSGVAATPILSGKRNTALFTDQNAEYFEFRSNDRIYSENDAGVLSAPAPMNAYKLIFFRYWKTLDLDGIQLGQETSSTARKWSGDVALVVLTSRDFTESEIMARSKEIATAYGLTLADVFPYVADKATPTREARSANIYDPPEGDRISEVLDESKKLLELKFTIRRLAEMKAARSFYRSHFPEVSFFVRNYNMTPPEDVEGYLASEFQSEGADQVFNYGFAFAEK